MLYKKKLSLSILGRLCFLSIIGVLVGCSATHTAINKRNLDVQTKMSRTIFFDPVTPDKRIVFVQVRNTSDKQELDLAEGVISAIMAKGYTIVQDPEKAHYILQANILQAGKTDLCATQDALDRGYGAALSGGVVGSTTSGLISNKRGAVLECGLLGAAISTVGDAMIQDNLYSVVADIQVSERVGSAFSVREKIKSTITQCTSGTKEITSTERVQWKRYQTRIIGTANQVNLRFEKAAPKLAAGIMRSIAGVF